MLTPKRYQHDALTALREYFHLVHVHGAKRAFIIQTDRPYHSVAQLPDLPYVCLRIPTGGGKTLVACHAVGLIQSEFLRQDRSLVLWLTPTDSIKSQTLAALRDHGHPYRQALDSAVRGPVQILELAEAFAISRAALDGATTIIISTMAAVRVEDTEGRRIYEQNGALMPHFDDIPEAAKRSLDKYDSGAVIPSLANLLCLRRPAVVVDEAHGARTDLSFEALARFNPACILELTATPTQPPKLNPSNVLYHVSAYELKAEHMIKLPIRLELRGQWREAIAAAVAKRSELQTLADAERARSGEYLRPIVLLQAQPKSKHSATLTVAVVRAALHDLGVPDDQIAEETGEVREVKAWEEKHGRTLFDERCPIRFIITVQALREGWDCPFAYVLCSVAELGTSTAVEQILGRVLRMPKATLKAHEDLNHAYAFVTSQRFGQVAAAVEGLTQALEANGFTRFEAQQEIESYGMPVLPGFDGPLFGSVVAERPKTPAERAEKFSAPQLALWRDGELLVVEPDDFLGSGWTLRGCDAVLTEADFPTRVGANRSLEMDINQAGQLTTHWLSDLHQQLSLLARDETMSADGLVRWLDENIPHGQIDQEDTQLYLLDMIERLRNERNFALEQLSGERYRLRDAAIKKINECKRHAKAVGYNLALFSDDSPVEVGPQRVFTFDPNYYPTHRFYEGPFSFLNHYYRAVSEMNGEEARCAGLIDALPGVKWWVRNLERRPDHALWLPTPTDKFYPDFVVLLKDGRTLVVEYKGGQFLGAPDAREKEAVGKLWEGRSGGKCVFRLVSADDYEAQLRAVADR